MTSSWRQSALELGVFNQCRAYITRGELTTSPSNSSNKILFLYLATELHYSRRCSYGFYINEGGCNEINSDTIEEELLRSISYFLDNERMYGDMLHEIWDVQRQKLDVRIGKFHRAGITVVPVFWTDKSKSILTACMTDVVWTICEFGTSTLEIAGAFFEGHTNTIESQALSFEGALPVLPKRHPK
jgi:hypothetical protein